MRTWEGSSLDMNNILYMSVNGNLFANDPFATPTEKSSLIKALFIFDMS